MKISFEWEIWRKLLKSEHWSPFSIKSTFSWQFGKPFEYSDASHSQFDQSQASILKEYFEFDA